MATITVDGTEYDSDNLSDEAKNQVVSLQFVKNEIARLQAQLAPFIDAHRPHDKPLNIVQLRQEFGPPCTTISPLSFDEICKQVDIVRKKKM